MAEPPGVQHAGNADARAKVFGVLTCGSSCLRSCAGAMGSLPRRSWDAPVLSGSCDPPSQTGRPVALSSWLGCQPQRPTARAVSFFDPLRKCQRFVHDPRHGFPEIAEIRIANGAGAGTCNHPKNLSSRHSWIAQILVTMRDGHESRGFAGAPDG